MKKFIAILITAITIVLTLSVSAGAVDIVKGDVNRDEKFDAFDLLALKRIVLGTYEGNYNTLLAADADHNDVVDAMDYLLLKRIYLGTAEFPKLPDRVPGEINITFNEGTDEATMKALLEDLCMEAYGLNDRAAAAQYISMEAEKHFAKITVPDEKIFDYIDKAKANENVKDATVTAIGYPC